MAGDARTVALRFNDAINARDLDALTELMADDHRFVDSAGTVLQGRSAVSAAWAGFFESFPDYRNEIETVEARGATVVMVGRSICRTPELHGPALWTATIDKSRVREWRVYDDDAETRAALGIDETREVRRSPGTLPALLLTLLAGLSPATARAGQEEPADSAILIRNVTVVDARGVQQARDVTVRGGLIESAEPAVGDSSFEGRTIDGDGRYLIPGLIDAHVHVGGSSRDETAALLAWTVQGGVTSIRDMAGDGRSLAGIDEALISGELTGPSLYYVGLMAGPAFMSDPRLEAATQGYGGGEAPYMIPLTEDTDLVRAVAMIKGSGATGVKLYAALDQALVEAATEEAHRVGLQVWAHSAVFPAKPVEVLDAGVDGVSHAPYVIWEAAPRTPDFTLRAQGDFGGVPADGPQMAGVIEAMVRNGTVLDPTLHVFNRMAEENPEDDQAQQRIAWGAAFTRLAREAGVIIAAGTDGLGRPLAGTLPNVHEEMALLVELAGFTPLEALAAGTTGGAQAIGIEGDVGTVEAGKAADLVLLDADPAASIRNTRRIVHVLRQGRLIR